MSPAIRLLLVIVCTLVAPAAVYAQEEGATRERPRRQQGRATPPRATRPFRPIFGAAVERPNSRQALDTRVTFDQAFGYDPLLQEDSLYPAGNAELQYRRRAGALTLTAIAGSSVQYYSHRDKQLDRSHNATTTLDIPVGPWTHVLLGASASYATFYTLSGLPGRALQDSPAVLPASEPVPGQELLLPRAEFGMTNGGGWQHATRMAVLQQVGRGGSIEARYGYGESNLAFTQTARRDTGVRYRQRLGTGLGVVSGYGVETNETITGDPLEIRNIDLGFDYQRALPGLRNTTVAITTGTAAVSNTGDDEYRVLADARLIHLMGRSWSTSVGFNRGLEYMTVLGDVLASDAVTGTLDGYLSRSLHASASGSYSKGNLGEGAGGNVTTYYALVRLEYGVTRNVAIDAQYSYYTHELGALATSYEAQRPSMLNQQRVRIGLNLWFPVLH